MTLTISWIVSLIPTGAGESISTKLATSSHDVRQKRENVGKIAHVGEKRCWRTSMTTSSSNLSAEKDLKHQGKALCISLSWLSILLGGPV